MTIKELRLLEKILKCDGRISENDYAHALQVIRREINIRITNPVTGKIDEEFKEE